MRRNVYDQANSDHQPSAVTPIIVPLIFIMALVCGCSRGETPTKTAAPALVAERPIAAGCLACHPFTLDANHLFPCEECHRGAAKANSKQVAHAGMLPQPAHPDHMGVVCGKCHGKVVAQAASTLHFTLAKEVNLVRQAFAGAVHPLRGADGELLPLDSLTAIPQRNHPPQTPLQLADDLLRRRCLRCHLYAPGDSYPATRHGTGCAACHLTFANGALADHRFLARPTDQQCLSCHYGNRVGADYYGRFEHDIHWDFRTPLAATAEEQAEPYGVGFHQLTPDLHQRAGLACIDCHGGGELMAGANPITCLTCHGSTLAPGAPEALSDRDGRRELTLALTGKRLPVPLMKDPAHGRYGAKVACQVCHGQWSFADHGNHLLLAEAPDYDAWQALTRQGSSEVEARLEAVLFQNSEAEAAMSDGITGISSPGIWLQAYELRRWEEINTCLDGDGILQLCRPILDLHLSYTNADGEVVFAGLTPGAGTPVLQPYTPHTTGRAGAFYPQRLVGKGVP